jgi:hypothetical protein
MACGPPYYLPLPTACGGSPPPPAPDPCCGDELSTFPDLTVTVPDGVDAGVYTAVYRSVGMLWACSFTSLAKFRMKCEGGSMLIYENSDHSTTDAATAFSCDPLLFTFPGTIFGSTGDIEVEL